MATRRSWGNAPSRKQSSKKGPAGSHMTIGTTVSGPSDPPPPMTELADHIAEQ
jgi:hypothetical protein